MNHLAHFHLAGDSDELIVGALLGDHVKGPLRGELSPGIEQGVRLHRRIDAYTDSHPEVLALRRLFGAGERRLAGIVADLYFDHMLVLHWPLYHSAELRGFSERVHGTLAASAHLLPAPARAQIARMREHDLLCRYRETEVIDAALRHIGVRLGRERPMLAAVRQAHALRAQIESVFLAFYPQLIEQCRLNAAAGTR